MLGELITAIEGREWVARGSCDVDLVYENKKELEELEIVKKTQKQKQKQKKQSKQVVDKEGEEEIIASFACMLLILTTMFLYILVLNLIN